MLIYRKFLRDLLRNYVMGSGIAVLVVGGVIISTTLSISGVELFRLFIIMIFSLCVMMLAELLMFRRHIRPIRVLIGQETPSLETIREAYLQTHRFPALSVMRIIGPHFLGLSIPAMTLASAGIALGWLTMPLFYIGLAGVGAVLVASMHALLDFFTTAQAIRPMLIHIRELGERIYGEDVSLDGRVIVSIQRKFQLSAFLIGTMPLFLFSLATQIRLSTSVDASQLIADYWKWAAIILLLGVGFSSLGARMLASDIQQPIEDLHRVMKQVQSGDLKVRASDLYSDEFSRLFAGFNHMVKGLDTREKMNNQLLQSYYTTLAAALDARDAYTAGHSMRVARYSLLIGRSVQLSEQELDWLNKTALLHDIGKIGVRDAVLLKDGRLSEEEFEQIKRHPDLGESILKQIEPAEAMAPMLPGVRSHHERYDGAGYPDGLKGQDIPVFGRIIAVADAFDAMTSDRPYRKGMPVEKAMAILAEGKGSQWDPRFVQGFMDAYKA
ncbi:HD domain-containing phosphohydrolase [Paenibacillus qinlingensis]|uniref:HAMP domain-containing protein n=1 Tax=Paenibacillus qinlingensis TaxID=1837343 RepID=A0ABU1P418_9BACL|nr:HD domain-containing phosphohydrolase [Paenibacillus qinlingensis]MDR6554324.1 HAMP domain-containing protein [Paenibacillus qinlingensis]